MSDQLSDEELAALRQLIMADARRQWVVSGIKGVAGYIAVIAGGYLAFKGLLADFLQWGAK